ncbi:MmcQ/YjbR family DNA-binding protein [bacterium]|nr:MmcQ/YjbR family DNA-binding protein [bacterium]
MQKNKKGLVEVGLIKLSAENVEKILKQEHIYPGWHMNKKYWITVILDNSLSDEKIMELIEESHSFTVKKNKK